MSAAPPLSFAECRRAARAVATAPNGREALETVRPRGVAGVIRDRAPLALMLYVAAAEDRLVWQDVRGFALLEPPLVGPKARQRRGIRHGVLRTVDRGWGAVQFGAPALLALLVALLMAPVGSLTWPAVVLVLGAMVYVTVLMVAMAIWQLFFGRLRTADDLALESVYGRHWSMPLLHQDNDKRTEELLGQVRTRLQRLIADQARRYGSDVGVQVDGARLTETLICLHGGITSQLALARVKAEPARVAGPAGPESAYSLLVFDARTEDPARRPAQPQAFFRFYLGSVLAVLFAVAFFVMTVERGACAADGCDRALTTYPRALTWLAYQLVWRAAPGLEPSSGFAIALGWLLTAVLPTVILVAVVAYRRLALVREQLSGAVERAREAIVGTTRVLIVTVADVERDAVIDVMEEHLNRTVEPRYDRSIPVFAMGTINDTELFVVQAGAQGVNNPAGATTVAAEAIRHLAPHYAMIVGMCYGLRSNEHRIGDVLVSERIKDLDHAKLVLSEGVVQRQDRGEDVTPSAMLLTACRAGQRGWTRKSGVSVHIGQMLSWNKLLNADLVVDQLRRRYPWAIGGDMEGAGFHASTRGAGVESILVKGIADWGSDKNDDHQRTAARNAANFVLHLVVTGAFTYAPADRRG